ncbi:glycosyl hydrolase catalytic core domain-containing protein [Hirsutella rhossiliensis]|uniref:Glycosyl hydrolase catalytic core domain-containing protein n=1 Tax=Hirsutella rhossiliensis TaxID=111463 RepID=A0A9P8N2D5_9HYPO|nr:glycosyl hydrolase catalytic core domain-containing protein [Hirsutella rhossiliensis]KAH0966998.1 glycosyl hydrolase catalytic core domain-containing protein [Hirsutella rhossiliensis]
MLPKNILTFTAFAALAEQALASNSHRHLHRRYQLQKREEIVDRVTVWTTVYVNAPQETVPPPRQFLANIRPAQEAAKTSTLSTSTPVYSNVNAAVKAPESAAAAPQDPQTTLATSVKPLVQVEAVSPSAGYGDKPAEPSAAPSAPATTPHASGGGQGGSGSGAPFPGKRGVAYNDAKLANSLIKMCDKCDWAYNWGSSSQGLNSTVNFVPTLWGDQTKFTDHWELDAQTAITNGAKAMFSFNEPDNSGQANMNPEQAAAAHVQYLNPYGGKVLIGSPSVTNSGQPGQGIQWLKSFISECDKQQDKCRIDFCNVHWYSQAQYENTLYKHLEDAHEACGGKPIWLTEFAPVDAAGQPAETPGFLESVMSKLDGMDFVHAYAPFMCAEGKLMSANQLSDTGRVFVGAS